MSVPDEMAFPVCGCLDQPFISGIFPSGKTWIPASLELVPPPYVVASE